MKKPILHMLDSKGKILISVFLIFQASTALASAAEPDAQISAGETEHAKESPTTPFGLKWKTEIKEGPDQIYYFAEAISGKKLKKETYEFLLGVRRVQIKPDRLIFERVDDESVELAGNSEAGSKFFEDWKKAKINLQHKFGDSGLEFLDSVQTVELLDGRIQVLRKSNEVTEISLGAKKLHRAFDLKALRLGQINLQVDNGKMHPALKDIKGVSAVLNMPGFSFPVEVKEFHKIRLKKDNELTVGVKNPVPGAMRAFLFLPSILHFHFRLPRKEA